MFRFPTRAYPARRGLAKFISDRLLVLQCSRDGLFPLAGMEESVRKITAIYRKARAAESFSSRFFDVPHIFDVEMQEFAFNWFDARLRT